MNEVIERVGAAIAKASKELHAIYGVFDYSGYSVSIKPHIVRDFTNKTNQTIGEFDTSEEAYNFYKKICEAYIAKAAINSIREPTDEMLLAGTDQANHYRVWLAMIDEILK